MPSTEVRAKSGMHYLDKMPFFPPSFRKLDTAILIMFFITAEGVGLVCHFVMKMSKYQFANNLK